MRFSGAVVVVIEFEDVFLNSSRPHTDTNSPAIFLPPMQYPSRAGCPMCGIVQKAAHHTPNLPPFSPDASANDNDPGILWQDSNFTVYRENAHPVSSHVHLVILFKCAPRSTGCRRITI